MDSDVLTAKLDDTLLEPARIGWLGDEVPSSWSAFEAALRLVGARLDDTDGRNGCLALMGTFDDLETLSARELVFRAGMDGTPVLLFPGRTGRMLSGNALTALRQLTGDQELSLVEATDERRYTFGESAMLRPFGGQVFHESEPRLITALAPSRAATPLISSPAGMTFARYPNGRFVCVIPQLERLNGLLKDELRSSRFHGLLPLLLFLREALGTQAWSSMQVGAAFIIDDPNFRLARYGFLEYRALIEASREHGFHTAIAMIPIDWKKTSARVASLVRNNEDYVSIVIHGVDHLFEEFATSASLRQAEATLAEGLARMGVHARSTGLHFARAMIFPHGVCNATWMHAVRNAGLDGAISDWALPIDLPPSSVDPLYEMHPAEMSFFGFPLINRFPAVGAREELLFKAFLGKPLLLYAHHQYYREGLDSVVNLVEFLDRQVEPHWSPIDRILRSNYQLRGPSSGVAVRVFSNRVRLETVAAKDVKVVIKPSLDLPDDEICRVNGSIAVRTIVPGAGAAYPVCASSTLDLMFEPRQRIPVPETPSRPRLKSVARRLVTELRDQVLQPLLRMASVV